MSLCASRVAPVCHSFTGDDMIMAAGSIATFAFTIVEVYKKYKHVCIITHNTNRLA